MKTHSQRKISKITLQRYFSLMREVQEKKQDLMLLYTEVHDIKQSMSFTFWQIFNDMMVVLGKERKQLPDARRPMFTELITGDVYAEIAKYIKMNSRMNNEMFLLQEVKNGLENSLYYKTLRKCASIIKGTRKFLHTTPSTVLKTFFPYSMRRTVKYALGSLLPFLNEGIPVFIQIEWDRWASIRKAEQCDIFIFGITAFEYRTQRPQHLAFELAKKGHRVFYIENEFIPYTGSDWKYAPVRVKKKHENIYLVNFSCPNNLFIYSDKPSVEDLEILYQSLKQLIYSAQAINPVAKIDHPFWGYLIEKMGMRVVYDCMDEHSGFQDNSDDITRVEDKIIKQAALVLVSSTYLKKSIQKRHPQHIVILPNAGEYKHFSKEKLGKMQLPADIAYIPKPIIGYYGAIADWLDVDLIGKAARAYPEYSFVFIGRVMNRALEELALKLKNIRLLGEKSYDILPGYLKAFDVCTIPFLLTDLIKATHPVKFFEYAASGKPIVTTALPELLPYKSACMIAYTHKEYILLLKQALRERDHNSKKRIDIAIKNTWEMRGSVLDKSIRGIMFPLVSIVILSYDNTKMTIQCIESIRRRSFYPSLEIIVVDNASKKDDVINMRTYCKKKNITFVANPKNFGFAKGNNIGMKLARGKYIVLLNNDTVVTPGWIERLTFHGMKKHVGLVGPVTNNVGNEMLISLPYNNETLRGMEEEALEYTSSHWGIEQEWKVLAAFCWFLPKKVYSQVGGLDENFGKALFEDDDYCVRLKKLGYTLIGADDVFIHHYGSISMDKIKRGEYIKLFERNKEYFEQKWDTVWIPHHLRHERRMV